MSKKNANVFTHSNVDLDELSFISSSGILVPGVLMSRTRMNKTVVGNWQEEYIHSRG